MLNANFFLNATTVLTGVSTFIATMMNAPAVWIDGPSRSAKGKAVATVAVDSMSDYTRGFARNKNVRLFSSVSLPFARMSIAQMEKLAVNTRRGWQVCYISGQAEMPVLVNDKGSFEVLANGTCERLAPKNVERLRNLMS